MAHHRIVARADKFLAEQLERRVLLSSAVRFAAERMFSVGSYPESVVVADVNGDGKSDLLTPNYYNNTVAVLLGNGNGTFQGQQEFVTDQGPNALAVQDVSGDNKFDLAVTNFKSNTAGIFLGNGNGTFQTQQTLAVGTGPTGLILKDLNNDNKPDLAVTNTNGTAGTISVFLGNGNGTFQAQHTFAAGSSPGAMTAIDINGDGKTDLLFESSGAVSVLLGNGNGTFQARQTLAALGGSLVTADFNNDNKTDIALINGTVSVLLGNGNGTFQAARTFAVGSSSPHIVASDLNGDGKTDLAVSNYNDKTIGVLVGNGDGTFLPQQTFAAADYPGYLAAADFDGDGLPDLVTLHSYSNSLGVLLNLSAPPVVVSINRASPSGSTSSGSSVSFTVTFNKPVTGVDAADFAVPASGVAHTGLAVTPVSGSVYTVTVSGISGLGTLGLNLVGNGSIHSLSGQPLAGGPAAFGPQQTFADAKYPGRFAIADVNGDGKPDLITANRGTPSNFTNGSVSVLLGNGNGTFQAARTFAAGQDTYTVAVADINGDGKLDLVVANYGQAIYSKTGTPGNVGILLGNGNGTFQAEHTFTAGQNYPKSVAVADINGDGKPDLVAGTIYAESYTDYNTGGTTFYSAGRISVLLGNGNGTFQAPLLSVTNETVFGVFPVVADVNGDKKLDLVVADTSVSSTAVLLGNGNGSFQAIQTFAGTGSELAVADVNGDGRADIVAVYSYTTSDISILPGLGNGGFQAALTTAVAGYFGSPVVVDMNGDGIPDLVGDTQTGIGILLGNGNGTFQPEELFATGVGNESTYGLKVADVNGDGLPDAVVTYVAGSGSGLPDGTRAKDLLLGQPDGNFTGQVYTIVPPPTVTSINRTSPSLPITSSTTLNYTVTFSTAVTGLPASAFQLITTGSVAAGTLTVTPSGTAFTVTINGVHGNGTLQLELVDRDNIFDGLGTPLGGAGLFNGSFAGQVYTVLQTFPTVLSINRASPPTPTTVDNSVSFAVTFSEPVTGVDATDFALSLGGVVTTPPLVVTGSGAVYTVTINGISGTGTLGLNLVDNGSIRDAIGNPLQNTAGTPVPFQNQQTFAAGSSSVFVATGDVNGDGRSDLIIANNVAGVGGIVSVLLGNGNGTFSARQTFVAGSNPYSIAVVDVNGDGNADLVVVDDSATGAVSVLLGNGNGTFQAPGSFAVGANPRSVAVVDLNGDGKPDLVVGGSSFVSVLMSNGDGTFQAQRTLAAGTHPYSVAAGDVNGDGKADVISANLGGNSVSVFLGNGDGSFLAQQTFATGPSPRAIAVADVSGDGQLDLIAGSGSGNTVSVLLGNGNGSFQTQQTFATGGGTYAVAVSGVNGDAKPDLILANKTGNALGLLVGNGNGTFLAQQTFATGGSPASIAISDFNGDGKTDLAVANSGSGTASVLLNGSSGSFIGQSYLIVPGAESITGTSGNDSITLTRDNDGTDIDWSLFTSSGSSNGELAINDPHGLTINGNGGGDTIILSYANGNPLPNMMHLNGTFTLNGLSASNPLGGTTIEIGTSTVNVNYAAGLSPAAFIQQALAAGYHGGAWNGSGAGSTGAITSAVAAGGAAGVFGVGYADSTDGVVVGQPANTVEIRYTLMGDANLDRVVNGTDALLLGRNYLIAGKTAWDLGNFNYDSTIDLNDAAFLRKNFNATAVGSVTPAAVLAAASAGNGSTGLSTTRSGSTVSGSGTGFGATADSTSDPALLIDDRGNTGGKDRDRRKANDGKHGH